MFAHVPGVGGLETREIVLRTYDRMVLRRFFWAGRVQGFDGHACWFVSCAAEKEALNGHSSFARRRGAMRAGAAVARRIDSEEAFFECRLGAVCGGGIYLGSAPPGRRAVLREPGSVAPREPRPGRKGPPGSRRPGQHDTRYFVMGG